MAYLYNKYSSNYEKIVFVNGTNAYSDGNEFVPIGTAIPNPDKYFVV